MWQTSLSVSPQRRTPQLNPNASQQQNQQLLSVTSPFNETFDDIEEGDIVTRNAPDPKIVDFVKNERAKLEWEWSVSHAVSLKQAEDKDMESKDMESKDKDPEKE